MGVRLLYFLLIAVALRWPTLAIADVGDASSAEQTPIDRHALVTRNNPRVYAMDSLSSLTVGNGEFAFTVDITGLQTFPERYKDGVPLGTQSQWGWHSFPNPDSLRHDETLKDYDFGRGRMEPYSVQFSEGRPHLASEWYRVNPHRLHLGNIGFAGMDISDIGAIDQTLDLWDGVVRSSFDYKGQPVKVITACDPILDMVAIQVSASKPLPVSVRMPYPTGNHADDACYWGDDAPHSTNVVEQGEGYAVLRHTLDDTCYYLTLSWSGKCIVTLHGTNEVILTPENGDWSFTAHFTPGKGEIADIPAKKSMERCADWWHNFWKTGGVVDFSECTDSRAPELERRVVLSQYLLAAQCAGTTPPQETGLTYNSWFGKYHLEMIWWHQAHFPLWGHPELLARTLPWYEKAAANAWAIASRQGFKGLRWMKMTDPDAGEAPSKVGSFLIWQQPHIIYLAELLYRATGDDAVIDRYYPLVMQTAEFMADFAEYDGMDNRYVLRGVIPAQETLRASETVNPPFELAYWYFALNTAQKWRERKGERRNLEWDEIADKLSPLSAHDGLYLAAETALDTYKDIRFTSDHPAVLAAYGVVPKTPLVRSDVMQQTFDWIYDNWNWGRTWGWDYPTAAMCAARLGQPEKAVDALLMAKRTNTYLPNGHNYQDKRLRCYLPGNGGLLTAVAMMAAGWDGSEGDAPGFPKDGTWNIRHEGLSQMP